MMKNLPSWRMGTRSHLVTIKYIRRTSFFGFRLCFIYIIIHGEEVIYSQESPNMVEFYRDFDWELDRFVEYRLPIN